MDDKVWRGVEMLLDGYVGIKQSDLPIIIYTSDSQIAATLISAALEIRKIPFRRVWMAPLSDPDFGERLETALPTVQELKSRLVVLTFEKDTFSHTAALSEVLIRYPAKQVMLFRVISACEELFSTALQADPEELERLNTALLERFLDARKLRIRTTGGSDLEVELDSDKHRWISNRGAAKLGGTTILPAGEVATFPAAISGTHVADFAYNVNAITPADVRLDQSPVTIHLSKSRVVDYHCDDPKILAFLDECLAKNCAFNVGELGFGTNFAVDRPIALNSHINERRPGVHIGLGQHNQAPGVVGYQCPLHLDLIAKGGLVWVDDDKTPIDLEAVAPSRNPHPDITRDEDVFSPEVLYVDGDDCCGLVTADGLQRVCDSGNTR